MFKLWSRSQVHIGWSLLVRPFMCPPPNPTSWAPHLTTDTSLDPCLICSCHCPSMPILRLMAGATLVGAARRLRVLRHLSP